MNVNSSNIIKVGFLNMQYRPSEKNRIWNKIFSKMHRVVTILPTIKLKRNKYQRQITWENMP
jgi:hypothetical protein